MTSKLAHQQFCCGFLAHNGQNPQYLPETGFTRRFAELIERLRMLSPDADEEQIFEQFGQFMLAAGLDVWDAVQVDVAVAARLYQLRAQAH